MNRIARTVPRIDWDRLQLRQYVRAQAIAKKPSAGDAVIGIR
jgi:hypothetical protein